MPAPNYEDSLLPQGEDWHTEYVTRSRAYELWEQAGRPEGTTPPGRSWAEHFWLQAEAELNASEARGK